MSMIDVSNLTFGYEGSPELIFDHVGFQIDSGWKLGFTGRNGRGKTTFLRLLQGEYPYSGTISASVEFEYFPYEVANLSRTGLEVVREIAPEAEDWEIQRELGLLDLAERSLELPFSSLSNGERTKVLLAAMFLKENAFLLIDEPTNHLDLEGRRKLGSYLARKRGFLLVSHDRAFLDQCVDHILAINRTNIEIQRGNFSSWWENRRRQDAFELARQEKLQKDIGRLTESARRASGWSDRTEKSKFGVDKTGAKAADRGFVGHKAAKLMQRSKSIQRRREEAVEEKKQLLQNLERQEALAVTPLPCRAGARLAEFRDVAVCYDGRTVCRDDHLRGVGGGADRPPGRKRLRQVQPAEAAAGGRDPPQRHGGDHERPGGVLCQPEYGPPAGQPDGVCPDPGPGRQPVPDHPAEAGCSTGAV